MKAVFSVAPVIALMSAQICFGQNSGGNTMMSRPVARHMFCDGTFFIGEEI